MYLKQSQSQRLYRLFFGLLRWVNEKYDINDVVILGGYDFVKPEDVREVTEYLWNHDHIIDEYLLENPNELDTSDIETVQGWKHHLTGAAMIVAYTNEHTIFLYGGQVFGVSGIANEISEMIPRRSLPAAVNTTLIPFDGKVIYDTIISSFPINIGANMKESCEDEYAEAKKANRIICTELEFHKIAEECMKNVDIAISEADARDAKLAEDKNNIFNGDIDAFDINKEIEIASKTIVDEIQNERENDANKYVEVFTEMSSDKSPKYLYRDMLSDLKVAGLKKRAESVGIAHSGKTKSVLIDSLVEKLVQEELLQIMFRMFSDAEFDFWVRIAENGTLEISSHEISDIYYFYLGSFMALGLYKQDDKFVIVMPDEIRDIFQRSNNKEFNEQRKHSQNLDRYATALTSLYGVISGDDFIELYNEQNSDQTDMDDLFQTLIEYIITSDSYYVFWHDYIACYELEEDDFEFAEYLVDRQDKISRKSMSKEELLKYDGCYYEVRNEHKLLFIFLRENIQGPEHEKTLQASAILDDIYDCAQYGSGTEGIVEILDEYDIKLDFDGMNLFLHLLSDVMNNTRTWLNNGHTPSELREMELYKPKKSSHQNNIIDLDARRRKKIGRNESCPCGSGKKYKNCCGKEDGWIN